MNDKYLIVADARLGLLRVDLPLVSEPARVTVLLSAYDEVDNFPLHFLDYPVVLPDGRIAVTQVDMFREFDTMIYTALENGPGGRCAVRALHLSRFFRSCLLEISTRDTSLLLYIDCITST